MLSRTPRGWGRLPGSRESLLSRTIKWPDMMSHLWRPHAEYLGCIRVTFFVFGFIETTNPWYEIIRNRQLSLWESAKWLAQRMAPQWRLKSLWGKGPPEHRRFMEIEFKRGHVITIQEKLPSTWQSGKRPRGHLAQVSDATAHLGSRAAPIRPSNVTKLDWLALSPVRKSIERMLGSSRVIFSPRCRKYKKHPRALHLHQFRDFCKDPPSHKRDPCKILYFNKFLWE